jgi:hypothetical protein
MKRKLIESRAVIVPTVVPVWGVALCLTLGLPLGLMTTPAHAQGTIDGVEWVRPFADWTRYDRILLKPLDISDVKVLKPFWEQDSEEDWEFTPGVATDIQDMFARYVGEELSRDGGYPVVSEVGADVLQIEVEFLSITPYSKPGAAGSRGGYEISTLGSGDVVVSAEFRDGETGSLMALIEGERTVGSEYRELTPENHRQNLEQTFRTWGRRIRAGLDEAHGRSP